MLMFRGGRRQEVVVVVDVDIVGCGGGVKRKGKVGTLLVVTCTNTSYRNSLY